MTGRNAGFHPKDAVVSILSALRERNAGTIAEGPDRDMEPARNSQPASRPLAQLSGGCSLVILEDTRTGLDAESRHWRSDSERHPAASKSGVGRTAFSIRSPEGKSIALIVADGEPLEVREVLQPRSVSHALPSASRVARVLVSTGVSLGKFEQRFGCVTDRSGVACFIDETPGRLELETEFYGHFHDPVTLPETLSSTADFTLMDSPIARNPNSMSIGGNLSLVNTRGLVLPPMLHVQGDLLLYLSDAEALPERFSVGRDLNIAFTPIAELPQHFHVGRHVVANDSRLSRIGGGARFKGNLDLRNCPIAEVPWGLEVNGYLDLTGTGIRHVPSGTVVKGDLRIEESVVVHPNVRLGGRLLYGRPYGYETATRG